MSRIKTIHGVVAWRLCLGCGACVYASPPGAVELFDYPTEGIRPVVKKSENMDNALAVCPVLNPPQIVAPRQDLQPDTRQDSYIDDWGYVQEIWEGYATDQEVRFRGSSGGILTALALYCIEQEGFEGVLHTGQDAGNPLQNRSRLSRNRSDLLAAAGSRYAPAAVCDGLNLVERASSPCVVIGKPVEIAAVTNARKLNGRLDQNVGLTMSFFCAETPSTAGSAALLRQLGADPKELKQLRYRGYGWPGNFTTDDGINPTGVRIPYRESWRFLQSYRAWATHLWPDGSGEAADISCGDPWYEKPDGENPGFSLIVVRTARGRDLLERAMKAGYVTLSRADGWKLERSQDYLRKKKAEVWGRLLAMRLLGLPTPNINNKVLFRCWMRLAWKEKLRSIIGTSRRILQRRLFRPLKLDQAEAVAINPAYVADSRDFQ